MSCPLSSLVNPLDKEQVLLYCLSSNQTPALELHHVGAEKTTATAFADNLSAPVDSKIVNPGSFSALYNEKLVRGISSEAPAHGSILTERSSISTVSSRAHLKRAPPPSMSLHPSVWPN